MKIELDIFLIWVCVVAIIAVATFAIIGPKIGCSQYSEITGKETKFSFTAGCFVKTERGFMPLTELEKRAITNE